MTTNYKSYRIRAMLECGHVVSHKVEYPYRVPPEWIHCGNCGCEVLVYAFETREWRAKCKVQNCRYSRWAGQSEESAKNIKRMHYLSKAHDMAVSYNVNPEIFEIIRHHYRRQFQFRIPDKMPRIPYARKRGLIPDEPQF